MCRSKHLPDELVLQIISMLHPSALINFSSTSKRYRLLSLPTLSNHKKLLTQHRNAVNTKNPRFETHSWVLLERLLEDPNHAFYVRSLKIKGVYTSWYQHSFIDWDITDIMDPANQRRTVVPYPNMVSRTYIPETLDSHFQQNFKAVLTTIDRGFLKMLSLVHHLFPTLRESVGIRQ